MMKNLQSFETTMDYGAIQGLCKHQRGEGDFALLDFVDLVAWVWMDNVSNA